MRGKTLKFVKVSLKESSFEVICWNNFLKQHSHFWAKFEAISTHFILHSCKSENFVTERFILQRSVMMFSNFAGFQSSCSPSYDRSVASSKTNPHIAQSSSSSCHIQYPLFSLISSSSCLRLFPHLSIISILPCIFTSITYFRRQFLY